MDERCFLLENCETVNDSVYSIDLSGRYYIPSFLLLMSEVDPRLEVIWREKANGSFTKMVYDACTFGGMDPEGWREYLDDDEKEELVFYPKFSLYDSKENTVTHYCSVYPITLDCNVEFKLHNGELVDVSFANVESTVKDMTELRYDGNDIDFRYFIAANIKLCQRKVLSIKFTE
jgi:hypothetical protein